jgi:hypothetical protein
VQQWIRPDWDAPPSVVAVSTTRDGGISTGSFASMNLGAHVGDTAEAVGENRRRFRDALGTDVEPMRMDKLTSKFQMALADAQSLAVGRDNQFIEPVHLMVALLDQDGGTVRHLLAQADVNVNRLRSALGEALERLPQVSGTGGDVSVSNALGKLLNLTDKLAQARNDQYISSELFVLAALEDKGELGNCCARPAPARAHWRRPSSRCAAASRSTTRTPRSRWSAPARPRARWTPATC